jgi:RNA polymerase sigma factor (sigma-70 family)
MSHSRGDRSSRDDTPTLTKELLALYLRGDTSAERRLFERSRSALVERARRHPRMRAAARTCSPEDVVQEVFRRALVSGMLRSFEDRGRGSLDAALTKVLDNTLVDIARREGSLKRGGAQPAVALEAQDATRAFRQVAGDETTPTNQASSRDLLEWVRTHLEPREFEIWKAVDVEKRSSAEVAQAIGSTSSAVRGVVFRAQRKLITAMERSNSGLRSDGA